MKNKKKMFGIIGLEVLAIAGCCIYMKVKNEKETVETTASNVENYIWSEVTDPEEKAKKEAEEQEELQEDDYIKWVDFNVDVEALNKAYEIDIETYEEEVHIPWTVLLAYTATQTGGEITAKDCKIIEQTAEEIKSGEKTIPELGSGNQYYEYYLESYEAVLGGFLGEYKIQTEAEDNSVMWKKGYGLKAFHPIGKGFAYSDYDDFGASRTYGFKRRHLGHDMMGLTGTPIIAVESGTIEALGWNQYGGWRIGIRSLDKKRYYYYAHLRQNYPFAEGLEEGSTVTAGDVIGYMGHTGYSTEENVNNIDETHLHFGLQLIFNESQKEGDNEIWIDCYDLVQFLYKNRSQVAKVGETREWKRIFEMKE